MLVNGNPSSAACCPIFYGDSTLKYPHSFPTRRSSDLELPLSNVTVSDAPGGPATASLKADGIHNVGDSNNDLLLDVGEARAYIATPVTPSGRKPDTATASSQALGTTVTATDTGCYKGE